MSEQETASVYHILALTFPGKDRAAEVAKTLKIGAKDAGLKIVAGAVIEVDERGKTTVHQPGRGGMGTALGLGIGGVLGLVGGPAGLLVWAAACRRTRSSSSASRWNRTPRPFWPLLRTRMLSRYSAAWKVTTPRS